MTRLEGFKILQLDASAGPSAIKQAYRKLAFELHPDLHPELENAAKRFQELNEAYVLLMQEYANTSYGTQAKNADHSGAAGHTDAKTRDEARKAYEKAKSRFESGQNKAESTARQNTARETGSRSSSTDNRSQQYRKSSREEILRDLLEDPFARRVFEDIYSHLRHNKGQEQSQAKPAKAVARPKNKKKAKVKPSSPPMLISMGSKAVALAGNLAGNMKTWLRKQIDDEQTMYLPADSLYPGMRLRLQVRHGLSEKSRTIEFTLPPEFQQGRPIRLKGLGKHLGKIQGDLYLRVYSREELEEGEEE